jgi:tetratricopeptide (TPR) repeat protein
LIAFWLIAFGICTAAVASDSQPLDTLTTSGLDHFYNMDYDRSIQDFEKVVEKRPGDAMALNHLLNAVLIRELYDIGAMNTGEYAGNSFIGQAHRAADPKVKERIKQLVQRAEIAEESKLKSNPDDVDALYARGVTEAQFSLYTGLVERAWFSALRNAVGARHDHERVLELSPGYVAAKLVVGTHNYVMGSLPWSVKAAVALVGLAGSKEKGIEYLKEVGQSGSENSVDAQIVLALFLRREGRFDESRGVIRGLTSRFPRNYLLALEDAHLLRASGHPTEAAAGYRAVFQAGQDGKYGRLHYEIAAYGLGELLRSQKNYADAATAFEMVGAAANPDPETLQKANLAAGEMYDAAGKRDLATKKYQAVIAENGSTPQAATARKCLQQVCR